MVISTTPLVERSLLFRLDVIPFVLLQVVLLVVLDFDFEYYISAFTLGVVQAVTYLSTHWNINARVRLHYSVSPLQAATHILAQDKYRTDIIKLDTYETFTHCNLKYIYDTETKQYEKLKYPSDLKMGFYQSSSGIEGKPDYKKWNKNQMILSIPTFKELMKEQIVAPFFIFQVFCAVLWMMDEYWYFSLFTLVMLLVFESTVVMQRIMSLNKIRSMRPKLGEIWAMREGQWKRIPAEDLVPGDLCSPIGKNCIIPADLLLINGTCSIDESILTGEAIVLLKDSIQGKTGSQELDMAKDKVHILFGGTELIKANGKGPGNGPVCFVLRTGWSTTQGKLMRAVQFSGDRVSVNSGEAFLFIFILLLFAIIADGYVIYKSMDDPNRDKYKLLLKCIIILTSVVPPELPIELALAVNASILALQQKLIFCTEPFRIPLAGKVNICCLDKTGTLTDRDFEVQGFCNEQDPRRLGKITPAQAVVVAGCHSLTSNEGEIEGDPVEVAAFRQSGYKLNDSEAVGQGTRVQILQRFPFNAELRRMSAVVRVETNSPGAITPLKLVCKGAPESLRPLLSSVPTGYDDMVSNYVTQGLRVIALASRDLSPEDATKVHSLERSKTEHSLNFVGLFILRSPLKKNTAKVIENLQGASMDIKIITGDNIHTAAQVALELKLGKEIVFVADGKVINSSGEVVSPDTEGLIICINGDQLADHAELVQRATVFARTSPAQKAEIISQLSTSGTTLMCGDGTNDVRGLKKAHVGLAIVNKAEEKPQVPTPAQAMNQMTGQAELGDATIAAPFTSKHNTILSLKVLLQQGRCTLVTTYQMYRILALNCLMSAYCLSVLYLEGVRFGDTQITIQGVLVAFVFFHLSRARPIGRLSRHTPPTTIFEANIIISIAGQFLFTFLGLLYIVDMGKRYMKIEEPEENAEFAPNLVNTLIYLYGTWINTLNVFVNYQGLPFMERLQSNTILWRSLLGSFGLVIAAIFEFPDVDYYLELVPWPSDAFKYEFLAVLVVVFILNTALERILQAIKYPK